MRVIFLGGGTGGHLVPGIAVAEQLRAAGHSSLFVIAGREVERQLLVPRGLAHEPLLEHHRGAQARPSPLALGTWLGAAGRWRALVRRHDPDAIVVLGGWVALPALITGFLGRPSVLIEQNAVAGRVSRRFGRRVDHVCLTRGGDDMPRGRRGTHLTGNPAPPLPAVERGAAAAVLGLDPGRRTLLLMGGSQGASDLNALLPALGTVLASSGESWQVFNITGGRGAVDQGDVEVPVVQVDFVQDMAPVYSVADVAVCRAGAGTVTELAATGTPSVLVPYPHHADRHQVANALPLVRAGGALLVPDDDPTGRARAPRLLAEALGRLRAMGDAARSLSRPDAAERVTRIVLDAAAGRHATPGGSGPTSDDAAGGGAGAGPGSGSGAEADAASGALTAARDGALP